MAAILNDQYLEDTLLKLRPGQEVFTVSWAMAVGPKRDAYLDLSSPTWQEYTEDNPLLVRRNISGGYVVDVTRCRSWRWKIHPIVPSLAAWVSVGTLIQADPAS